MTLFDPVSPKTYQIVYGHAATKKRYFLRRAPPWADNLDALSEYQAKVIADMIEFGLRNLVGRTGTTQLPDGRRIGNSAFYVMQNWTKKGLGAYNPAYADLKEGEEYKAARRKRIARRQERMEDVVKALRKKGARVPAGYPVSPAEVSALPGV